MFVVLLYKMPALTFLKGHEMAQAVRRYLDVLLMLLLMRWLYSGCVTFGFRKKNLGKGMLLVSLLAFLLMPREPVQCVPSYALSRFPAGGRRDLPLCGTL